MPLGPYTNRTVAHVSWYGFFKLVGKGLGYSLARIDVTGRENIPRSGPFFLIPNHQSVLDPILVQAVCPRTVHSFTKSTQFASPVFRWLLPRLNAIPTRRYRVDPQVVRVALRLVEEGRGIGIYPEGERSWDGSLQPLRRGTVRLLLKAGAPVVPCGVVGSYDVWPRWSRRPRRCGVSIRFGKPLHFGKHDEKSDRERALDGAIARLARALEDLVGPDQPSGATAGLSGSPSPDGGFVTRPPKGAKTGALAPEL